MRRHRCPRVHEKWISPSKKGIGNDQSTTFRNESLMMAHLEQNGRQLALQGQKSFGESGGRHLNATLIRGVNLQVVPVSGMQSE